MKASELRELKTEDLPSKLKEFQKKLYELRMQSVTENLEDKYAISKCRKDIARVKTIIRKNQLKAQ
ncbi:50S ribosomal protein L29 [Sedimentisphaera salicampi]|uniref:Large ribosomal subunit protein uL29 n=1 Tax=Sedimentisphaera salicampi TaxID=1941349 RepID=A0A1W6LPG3_9BACT|nr:50S ribosomal protein L29 [Sedimentisphaera salicampi]ARN57657.1 50S ribosomal protein L29 [Sedimentisphaera salicampi]OXU14222.1 50S ribosomal protein L29 [Sedimentisphaera salicampi]